MPSSPPIRIGLYPGTFDPITLGHIEIITRAARMVDKLIVGVAKNAGKGPLFDCKTRVRLVEHDIAPLVKKGLNIEVRRFDTLLMHYARDCGAQIIIRGLRAVSDFEYEFQMAGMNYRLDNGIETVFLMASDKNQFTSSSFIKEIARLGGDVHPFASANVVKALTKSFADEKGRRKVVPVVRD